MLQVFQPSFPVMIDVLSTVGKRTKDRFDFPVIVSKTFNGSLRSIGAKRLLTLNWAETLKESSRQNAIKPAIGK
jgi:hypothetical protein